MKEITRIHIAKTPYDIEIDAKKELEKYSKQLGVFVDSDEVMMDVEVRMTELLAEHGIQKGDVVTLGDVRTVRAQLGEPHEFAGDEGDIAVGVSGEELIGAPKRLYRDTDTAVLGGVLAGTAKFFGVNPLWTRLIFVLALFASFGTAAIVYVVVWLVVPPARTAAEKLQLEGLPITLSNMKELRDQSVEMVNAGHAARTLKHIVLSGLGILAAVGALAALIATIAGAILVGFDGTLRTIPGFEDHPWLIWVVYGLMVASGLLLTSLGIILSYLCFSRRWTKRIAAAIIVIVLAGLATFGSGVGTMLYRGNLASSQIDALRQTSKVTLPANFADVKNLSASAHSAPNPEGSYVDFTIQYVVDSGSPRYVLESLPDVNPVIKIDGDQARVILKSSAMQSRGYGNSAPRLVIYGPALATVKVEQGHFRYVAQYMETQDKLAIESIPATTVDVAGSYDNVTVDGGGEVDVSASSVRNLSISTTGVTAGVVGTLTLTQLDVCPLWASLEQSKITVQGVSTGQMTYNGKSIAAVTHKTPCGVVVIGSNDTSKE